jgi:hypothetical protein
MREKLKTQNPEFSIQDSGAAGPQSRYNAPMSSENRILWIVAAVLVALIAVPSGLWRFKEARRPVLEEVQVVTAAAGDGVFRDGPRRVPPGVEVEVAAALRLGRADGSSFWLAPVAALEIDGRRVEHVDGAEWPEDDRVLRVFWFTIEGSFLGGDLSSDKASKLLALQPFLAPEMGRALRAERLPEQHNDDQINLGDEVFPVDGGTIRLYVRVELTHPGAPVAVQSASSLGADSVDAEAFPTLYLAAELGDGVDPAAGELFRLSGFEPLASGDIPAEEVTREAFGAGFDELVDRRLVVSSRTFASTALSGGLAVARNDLAELGRIDVGGGRYLLAGRGAQWGADLRSGDVLEDRGQWVVLLGDDGDGVLGPGDRVTHCWRRPPVVTILDQAIRDDADQLVLLRHDD